MKTKSPFALCLRHRRMPYAFFITLCLFLSFLCFSQGVSINTTGAEADNSAALDISSTNQGLLIPRLTTANRPASPATGLIIYNTDCNDLQYYNGTNWISVKTSLVAPVATSGNGATQNQFTANWSASDGATSYYLDVSTSSGFGNFATGFNNLNAGNVTTCNVTGLSGNTAYYYRLRANNSCNLSSNSNTISITTANLAANIVAYWKFEGNSNDATGNSHTGTDHTITYNSTYGKIGQGGLFTRSVPSYIDLGTAFDYAASAFTISAWAYPTVNTLQDAAYSIFTRSKDASDYDGFGFSWQYLNSGYNRFASTFRHTATAPDWYSLSTTNLSINSWYHVVLVSTGTAFTLYVNGVACNTVNLSGSGDTGSFNARIGKTFDGYIDEVGIWSRALSAGEVSALYNSGVGLQYPF